LVIFDNIPISRRENISSHYFNRYLMLSLEFLFTI